MLSMFVIYLSCCLDGVCCQFLPFTWVAVLVMYGVYVCHSLELLSQWCTLSMFVIHLGCYLSDVWCLCLSFTWVVFRCCMLSMFVIHLGCCLSDVCCLCLSFT